MEKSVGLFLMLPQEVFRKKTVKFDATSSGEINFPGNLPT